MRKICVFTGSRAEYGLLKPLMEEIKKDRRLHLQVLVSGMHLSREFGLTVKEIEKDGFKINEKVKMPLLSDKEKAIANSMGEGMMGFAKAYYRLKPDILVTLGDRFEVLSAAAAALPFRIPIAHLHGGESTEGLIDEAIRHAVTKMSHLHFVATKEYRNRVIQMGESPRRVFCFGMPGLDNINKIKATKRKNLFRELGIPQNKKLGIVTYHPVTLDYNTAGGQITELLNSLGDFPEVFWTLTFSNADTGGRIINKKIKDFVTKYPARAKLFTSLGQRRYLSLLKESEVMVGNSSSGITEAPSFRLPVVNIGDRQRGRLRQKNIIDVPQCKKNLITRAIKKGLSKDFKNSLKYMKNIYKGNNASKRIKDMLESVNLGENLIKKKFYTLSQGRKI